MNGFTARHDGRGNVEGRKILIGNEEKIYWTSSPKKITMVGFVF
jgi:hypothetical protein